MDELLSLFTKAWLVGTAGSTAINQALVNRESIFIHSIPITAIGPFYMSMLYTHFRPQRSRALRVEKNGILNEKSIHSFLRNEVFLYLISCGRRLFLASK